MDRSKKDQTPNRKSQLRRKFDSDGCNLIHVDMFLAPRSSLTSINVVATQRDTARGPVQVSHVMPAAGSNVVSLVLCVQQ